MIKNGLEKDDEDSNIIYELYNGNGKMKDYNWKGLIFEGKYNKWERNGKGKDYKYWDIIFEGEYLNGKRFKGKEYMNKKLIFEG